MHLDSVHFNFFVLHLPKAKIEEGSDHENGEDCAGEGEAENMPIIRRSTCQLWQLEFVRAIHRGDDVDEAAGQEVV